MTDLSTRLQRTRVLFEAMEHEQEPNNPLLYALAGNVAGVIAVPDRPGYIYIRLNGDAQRLTVAKSGLLPPRDIGIFVRKRRGRQPGPYEMVGYAGYSVASSVLLDQPIGPGSDLQSTLVWLDEQIGAITDQLTGWGVGGWGASAWGGGNAPQTAITASSSGGSVTVTTGGVDGHELDINAKLSADAGQALAVVGDGLYAEKLILRYHDLNMVPQSGFTNAAGNCVYSVAAGGGQWPITWVAGTGITNQPVALHGLIPWDAQTDNQVLTLKVRLRCATGTVDIQNWQTYIATQGPGNGASWNNANADNMPSTVLTTNWQDITLKSYTSGTADGRNLHVFAYFGPVANSVTWAANVHLAGAWVQYPARF